MTKHLLKLYIAGRTERSDLAIARINEVCQSKGMEEFELVVIDVLERPQLAEDEKILATPTLVKELPPPLKRIVGDLSDKEKLLIGLDLVPRSQ